MRTTIAIDDDVLVAAKERARRQKRSLGEVISELARRGLTGGGGTAGDGEPDAFFGFAPFGHRGGTVSNDLVDRLREEEAT